VDIPLSTDQELLRATAERFIRESCPLETVRQLADSESGVDRDYIRQAGELGWFAMLVPEEFGGGSVSGSGLSDAAIVATERGRGLQPAPFVPTNVVADALAQAGSDDQRAKVLPAMAAGESLAAWVVAGPTGGWEAGQAVRCEAGGQGYLLQGTASLVQDAPLVDYFLVTAASEDGVTQFLVPAGTPGLHVERLKSLDLTRRFYQLRFDRVDVPESALVGQPGGASDVVDRQLQVAVVLTMAEMVGAMDHDFQMTLDYAKAVPPSPARSVRSRRSSTCWPTPASCSRPARRPPMRPPPRLTAVPARRRWRAWPKRLWLTAPSIWSRRAGRCSVGSATRGSTTSICICGG
jgi:alkylation response protein AidB-like acyl-CoA dehydrogenase